MSKKAKSKSADIKAAAGKKQGVDLEDALIAELCERIGPEALAEILAAGPPPGMDAPERPAGAGAADMFASCSPEACGTCPSKSAGCGLPQAEATAGGESGVCAPAEENPLPVPTEEERAAILALDHRAVTRALSADEPIAVAVATEYIVYYSLKVADALREGTEYRHVLQCAEDTSAVERIAMALVSESVRESLEQEAAGWYNA